jgi:hypothetical protein
MSFLAPVPQGGILMPVGQNVGASKIVQPWGSGATWYVTHKIHTMAAQGGATGIRITVGNWSSYAYPEDNLQGGTVTFLAEVIWNGISYQCTASDGPSGSLDNSVALLPGETYEFDPLPIYIPFGATYQTRIMMQTGATTDTVPMLRQVNGPYGEYYWYGTGTAPSSPMGADVVTGTTLTMPQGATLYFATSPITQIAAFDSAVATVPFQIRGPGLANGTIVTNMTSTTMTISPPAQGIITPPGGAPGNIPTGTSFQVFANPAPGPLTGNTTYGYGCGPMMIRGTVTQEQPSVIIVGDSIGAGLFGSTSVAINAQTSAGSNVLNFAANTFPLSPSGTGVAVQVGLAVTGGGGSVPAWTVVGSFVGGSGANSVTLVNAFTGAASNLIYTENSGTTFTFDQIGDYIGNQGYVEKGMVTPATFQATGATSPILPVPYCPVMNIATGSDLLYFLWQNKAGLRRLGLLANSGANRCICQIGVNDLSGASNWVTYAPFQSSYMAFWAFLRACGMTIIQCTITTETTAGTSSNWASTTGQVISGKFVTTATSSVNNWCVQFNDWVRNLPGTSGQLLSTGSTASGSNVLSFSSTTLPNGTMAIGLLVTGVGVPHGAIVGSFVANTSVTLVDSTTGNAANLSTTNASGTSYFFTSPIVGVIDAAAAQQPTVDSQVWNVITGTSQSGGVNQAITTDGIHPKGVGQYLLAAAVQTAIVAGMFD